MKNFDFGDLKYYHVAVHCNSQIELDDFIKQCEENGIIVGPDREFDKNYGYIIVDSERLYCDYAAALKNENYEIIEWKMESPFIENKIDYDREYTINEIVEMTEDNVYLSDGLKYKINNGDLYVYSSRNNEWGKTGNSIAGILDMKFRLLKQNKKVTFEEAIQAYGKTVYCIWRDKNDKMLKTFYEIKSNVSEIFDTNDSAMCSEEILNGGWYIKEE
ncbi:hypothetical protein FDB72_17445 [Clostridium botulinum]|jgi:hypothetical protein|nr:hypothetical protein [Clostridium botulinum]